MKREPMGWEECNNGHIRKVDYDEDKVKSMLKLCRVRLKVVEKIELDEETASIIAEGLYEIIKELLTALLLMQGLKSDNHECLIAFFRKNYPAMEYEAQVIYELKSVRNAIDYEGLFVKPSYIGGSKLEIIHIIQFLTSEVEERLKNR